MLYYIKNVIMYVFNKLNLLYSENIIIFLGLNFSNVIGTNVFPKDPVPPVTKIVEFFNIIIVPFI